MKIDPELLKLATAEELAELTELLEHEALLSSPAMFAQTVSGGEYKIPPHVALLDRHLVDLAEGKIRKLLVTMPPRHGKSELCSRYMPAWYLSRFPQRRVILTSYEAEFAASWGRKARDLIEEHPECGVKVRSDSKAAANWNLHGTNGGMSTAGAGGPITGKGAHCFPAGTLISTNRGQLPIELLMQPIAGTLVQSWDHVHDRLVYRPIVAGQVSERAERVEVITTAGRRFVCTPEHRVCVLQRGYREARDLVPGDRLRSLAGTAGMSAVWGAENEQEEAQGIGLSPLLSVDAGGAGHADVFVLQQDVRAAEVRSEEGSREELRGRLLRGGVLAGSPRGQEPPSLRDVWGSGRQENSSVLRDMSAVAEPQDAQAAGVPRVRGDLSAQEQPDGVLLAGVRGPGALRPDEGGGQLPLQGRHQLLQVLQTDAPLHHRTGRLLRGLWRGAQEALRASHQRGPEGQPPGEPCPPVRDLPRDSPQVGVDTVAVVRRLRDRSQLVYDLQVEGSHNFFAEGVLVHNCLIIDDPHKSAEEANSPIIREKVWEWYRATALTRLEPGGAVVLVQTRWHEEDLAGRCLAEEGTSKAGGDWTIVHLAALATEDDPLGREPGEALWPERYDVAALEQIRKEQGSYWFSSLYQGSPQPAEGGLFKRDHFRYWRATTDDKDRQAYEVNGVVVPMKDTWRFLTVDLAASTKATADFTVIATWAVTPAGDLLLLDRERMRLEGPDHLPTLKRVVEKWKPRYAGVERATYGLSLIQSAMREGIVCRELRPDRDKVARALQGSAMCEQGRVYFPAGVAWLGEWEGELLGFPTAAHDDQVDCLAYAAIELSQGILRGKRGRKFEPVTLQQKWEARHDKKRKRENHPWLGRIK